MVTAIASIGYRYFGRRIRRGLGWLLTAILLIVCLFDVWRGSIVAWGPSCPRVLYPHHRLGIYAG